MLRRTVILLILLSLPARVQILRAADEPRVPGAAPAVRHRFLAVDESRKAVHYVDEFDRKNDWKVAGNFRDIQLIGGHRIALSDGQGISIVDLKTKQITGRVHPPQARGTQSFRWRADGNILFVAGGVLTTDASGRVLGHAQHTIGARICRTAPDGGWVYGDRAHVIELDTFGSVRTRHAVSDLARPSIYHVAKRKDGGYYASCGYSGVAVSLDAKGTELQRFSYPQKNFFASLQVLTSGNLVVANWAGHGKDDVRNEQKGPQAIEFTPKGKPVWTFYDPDGLGSIHHVIILDGLDLALPHDEVGGRISPMATKALGTASRKRSTTAPETELGDQYKSLLHDLAERQQINARASETLRPEALIAANDRDPADIVLRRTGALLADLQRRHAGQNKWPAFAAELAALRKEAGRVPPSQSANRYRLYERICALRRRIALSNPLLNFDSILFIKRHRSRYNHMCDQYYGATIRTGGGLYVLSRPFDKKPAVRNVLGKSTVVQGRLKGQRLDSGSFLSPDLSYDAKRVAFAYVECTGSTAHIRHTDPARGHWTVGRCYHVFTVNTDGSDLKQITDGTWNDFDPCWLPNGRLAFVTERRGGYLRCGRACPTYTVYDMAAGGSDMRPLSVHETNEWHPSVTHNGRIIYTRWDYVDRHGCTVHLPWVMTPDGRDARAVHGNFAPRRVRPDMELDCRAVPGSPKFVATAAPHHGQAFGSLVLINPQVKDDDGMAPVRRITPEIGFPESQGGPETYGTPWPLSEDYHICVYDVQTKIPAHERRREYGNYGIYLVDSFGNKELLYRDPQIACQSPIPLRAVRRPPIVPSTLPPAKNVVRQPGTLQVLSVDGKPAEGTFAVIDVYSSLKPWPEGTKIEKLRVYQIIPMAVPSGGPPHETGLRETSSQDSVNLARAVLGTVPVEEDGSAHFAAPAHKEMFFQALDEQGLAVQSMRSSAYLQPGERLTCHGCHEPRATAPKLPKATPIALRRAPSRIQPDVDGSNPFSYPRLVQPILDKHCLECHRSEKVARPKPLASLALLDEEDEEKDEEEKKDVLTFLEEEKKTSFSLAREPIVRGFFASYNNLAPKYGFYSYGDSLRTTPGRFGARASKLYNTLVKGHKNVKLSADEMHRIALWLDSLSNFYGVYEREGGLAQLRGEIAKPTLE